MPERGSLTVEDLVDWFLTDPATDERVGVEVEVGVVDERTGRAARYGGPHGVRQLLEDICQHRNGRPVYDGDYLTGAVSADGSALSLEPGGALEYSSAPASSVASVIERTEAEFVLFSRLAGKHGLALLGGGNLPFDAPDRAPLIMKPRVVALCSHFAAIGADGAGSRGVMTVALSTQTTLDYLSEQDMMEKLRVQTAAAVVVAAMCVNSPLESGAEAGALSRRMQYLERNDPRRCGPMPFALREKFGFRDFVDWIIDLPMVYRLASARFVRAPNIPFRRLMADGFGDGTLVDADDWSSFVCQVWPYARLRRTLEVRLSDGLPFRFLGALPALWTGLCYDPGARSATWALLRETTPADHLSAATDVAVRGLDARLGDRSVRELAAALLGLAEEGLCARVRRGIEPPSVLDLLRPFRDVLNSGETFAARLLDRWRAEWHRRPGGLVDALRI